LPIIKFNSEEKCPIIHSKNEVIIAEVWDVIEITVNKEIEPISPDFKNIVPKLKKYSLVTYHLDIFINIKCINAIKIILKSVRHNNPMYLLNIYLLLEIGFESTIYILFVSISCNNKPAVFNNIVTKQNNSIIARPVFTNILCGCSNPLNPFNNKLTKIIKMLNIVRTK